MNATKVMTSLIAITMLSVVGCTNIDPSEGTPAEGTPAEGTGAPQEGDSGKITEQNWLTDALKGCKAWAKAKKWKLWLKYIIA